MAITHSPTRALSLSPKGTQLAFSHQVKGGVWLQRVAEPIEEPRLLDARGWGTAWSPDGTKIAYAAFSPVNLWVYDVVEATRTPLFPAENGPYRQIQWNFSWSPETSARMTGCSGCQV